MKKTYKMTDLDCAHCAQKIEDAVNKIHGVTNATVNFMTQKLTLEAGDEDFERVLAEAVKTVKRLEPDCRVIV